MQEALDPIPLLKALHEQGVEHIVVGGFAVNAHGFIRTTKDLDIVPSPAGENLEKLASLLGELNAQLLDTEDFEQHELPTDPTNASDLAMGGNFCVSTDLGRLDVMQWLAGVDFDDLYGKLYVSAIEGTVEEVPIRVCSLDDLIAMKRAAGRPQDLVDLSHLTSEPEPVATDAETQA